MVVSRQSTEEVGVTFGGMENDRGGEGGCAVMGRKEMPGVLGWVGGWEWDIWEGLGGCDFGILRGVLGGEVQAHLKSWFRVFRYCNSGVIHHQKVTCRSES